MQYVLNENIKVSHPRIKKPKPGHCAYIWGYHIGHYEKGTKEFFPVKVRPPYEPGQRESDQNSKYHGQACRNERISEGVPVQWIRIYTSECFQRKGPGGKESSKKKKKQGKDLEDKQESNNNSDEKPFYIEVESSLFYKRSVLHNHLLIRNEELGMRN